MATFLDNENENSPMVWTEIELSHNKPENKMSAAASVSKADAPAEQAHNALISSTSSSPRSPLSEIGSEMSFATSTNNMRTGRAMLVTPMVTANLQFDTEPRENVESVVKMEPETPDAAADTQPVAMSLAASPESNGSNIDEVETEADSEADRVRQEMEESERLCWEMMQQESMEAYNMQVNFMRENAEEMSSEDREALELILQQEAQPFAATEAHATGGDAANGAEEGGEDQASDYDDDDDEEGGRGGLDQNSENWSYDQLLALGEAIGDVKTEKWKQRAVDVIKSLPRLTYGEMCFKIATQQKQRDDHEVAETQRTAAFEAGKVISPERPSLPTAATAHEFTATGTPLPASVTTDCNGVILVQETKCAICRDDYESDNHVLHLRCGHYFHDDCCTGWLYVSLFDLLYLYLFHLFIHFVYCIFILSYYYIII